MEILGVGTGELIVILILMLVVAGPKRMLQWAYTGGQYAAKLRTMWHDVMVHVQAEFDEAGVNVQVPKEMPTRANLNRTIQRQMNQAFTPITQPLKETLDQASIEFRSGGASRPAAPRANDETPSASPNLGAWSQTEERAS